MRFGLEEAQKAAESAMRQGQFVVDRDAKWAKIRAKRRADLEARKSAIRRATDLYATFDDGEHLEVRLRSGFVWLEKKRPDRVSDGDRKATLKRDVSTRPPSTALIYRPGNAMQVCLTVIYVAHQENEPGVPVENDRPNNYHGNWVELSGLKISGDSPRDSNRRLGRALDKLEKHNLITAGKERATGRFGGFRQLREDGKGHPYEVPSADDSTEVIAIPEGFFRAGWHLVLTGEEIATFLAIADQSNRRRNRPDGVGIGISQSTRWNRYGLAAEAYTAHRELEEFGLIDVTDPEGRRNGKLKPGQSAGGDLRALEMHYPPKEPTDFSKSAFEVVMDKLKASTVPPRLLD